MKQTCILVLGMHRSGTSALTGVLCILDVYLSKTINGDHNNRKGYFENANLNKFNDDLLASINSSWDDVLFDEGKISQIKEKDYRELKKIIKEEFRYSEIFAIKDPRITLLFPVYMRVLDELDIDVKVLIPYRNPMEVACSLRERDGFSYEKGILLWIHHILMSEKHSRGYERLFISFDELMTDPEGIVSLISECLSMHFKSDIKSIKKEIHGFLDPGLKHHSLSLESLSDNTSAIVKDILSLREKFNDESIAGEFDALRIGFLGYQNLFYNKDVADTFSSLKSLQGEFEKVGFDLQKCDEDLHEHNDQLRDVRMKLSNKIIELDNTKRRLDTSETKLSNKIIELDNTKRRLDTSETKLSNKIIELDNTKRRLDTSETKLKNTNIELGQRDKEIQGLTCTLKSRDRQIKNARSKLQLKDRGIDGLQNELLSIYTGRSWKLIRVLRRLKRLFKS